MADRRLHPGCPNAGNPYHECVEDCYMKIANGKSHKSSKYSGHRSGGNEIVQRVPKERRTNRSCPKAGNPYHECGDHCFQNGTQADPRANRKQTGSAVGEAPISRRKNREPNSQIKPTSTEVLDNNAKAPIVSAADSPSSTLQFPSKERESERVVEYSKPLSPPIRYSGEIKPEDFSFNKGQVRSSNSVPTSGNATPVLGLSPDRRTLKDHLKDSFATVDSSTVSKEDREEDTGNQYFSNELVPEKVADNNNGQVATEAVRGSMSSSISGNSRSFRDSDDDDEYNDDVQSVVSEARVSVGKYHVKSSVSSILQAILEKYGDIAENCQLESIAMRSYYLECVCFVVQELQSMSFMNLTKSKVKEMLAIIKDLESSHIEIGWLRVILDELSEVTEFVSQHHTVKAAKVKSDQGLASARRELEFQSLALAHKEQEVAELKERVAETEEQLRELEAKASKLDQTVSSLNSQIENFHFKSSLQELL
ncbi:uncharacterized protein LOC116197350 [Punica granatum]|uniref:Uncharacterized protein LOC116197350 n=1 Tax=Punica granatum TaxID=22663 RepID=A0A218X663_PUNGR|nr:uncharacterized protein LOC116197350 [Punica granatum]XP_031383328.1 uncharacterized protein LOC116197350 [Punica granatum]OWM80434.1 hypothetical protein CDL15_Pgr019714 [Punica granatum]